MEKAVFAKGIVVVMVGIPGAGKSEYVKGNYTSKSYPALFESQEVVSLDKIASRNKRTEMRQYHKLLMEKSPIVIIDDTNVTAKIRRTFIWPALEAKYRVLCIWVRTPVSVCLERRKDKMVAVKSKAKEFEVPVLEEGFDQIIIIEGNDASLIQVDGVMPVG